MTRRLFSARARSNFTQLAHDGVITCPHCKKTFASAYTRNEHVRNLHGSETFSCACGLEFRSQAKKDAHELTCVISKPGATAAVKRRFAELSEETEDRGVALTQAFQEVRDEATEKRALLCCNVAFANAKSLKRHWRKMHKVNAPDAPTED